MKVRGHSRGHPRGRSRGGFRGPTHGHTRGPTRGVKFRGSRALCLSEFRSGSHNIMFLEASSFCRCATLALSGK